MSLKILDLTKQASLILTIILFTGCDWLSMTKKTDEKYLPNYELGDLLYFKSNTETDTFVVKQAGYVGTEGGEGGWSISVYSYKIKLVDTVDYKFLINRRIGRYSFFNFTCEYGNDREFDLIRKDTSIVICGDTISNLSQSPDFATPYVYGNIDLDTLSVVKNFLFERNLGLVQYQLTNGETFSLDEKSYKFLKERK